MLILSGVSVQGQSCSTGDWPGDVDDVKIKQWSLSFKNNEKVEKILLENKSSFSKAAGAVSQAVGGVLGRVSWFKTDYQWQPGWTTQPQSKSTTTSATTDLNKKDCTTYYVNPSGKSGGWRPDAILARNGNQNQKKEQTNNMCLLQLPKLYNWKMEF